MFTQRINPTYTRMSLRAHSAKAALRIGGLGSESIHHQTKEAGR